MFIEVRLLTGSPKSLTYRVPEELRHLVLEGSIVKVPVRERDYSALVITSPLVLPEEPIFTIRDIKGLELAPDDARYHQFMQRIAAFYVIDAMLLYQRFRALLRAKPEPICAPECVGDVSLFTHDVELTAEQRIAVDGIIPHLLMPHFYPVLLHGITGSGKTEVYKRLIKQALELGKAVIFLLPEVTLSLQFQRLLADYFSHIPVIGFHSAASQREKKRLWQLLIVQTPMIIVGVHLPILLPIPNLGLIIVDEEHDPGYLEKKYPRLHTKQIALLRAQQYGIPIVLGSATPSLNALIQVRQHKWQTFRLMKRFGGAPPTVKMVSLRHALKVDKRCFWITKIMADAIQACLARGEQAIIYLNRRGYSFFVQCRLCAFVFSCSHCSVSLTLHRKGNEEELQCHYCSYRQKLNDVCPECQAPSKNFIKKGIGTQQVVDILSKIFPMARIARADLDTTSNQQSWADTVNLFKNGALDILVGTQTITKGYHFPRVTLVGVLWADASVHFPSFDAGEVSLAQLIQIAGRAGRATQESLVIVQVLHDHPIFEHISEQQYEIFAEQELELRKLANYPPFCRLAQIELSADQEDDADQGGQELVRLIQAMIEQQHLQAVILGPSRPLVHKVQQEHRRHIFIKAASYNIIQRIMEAFPVSSLQYHLSVTFL